VVLHSPFDLLHPSNWSIDYLSTRASEIGQVLSKTGTFPVFKYSASQQPLSESSATREEVDYREVVFKAKTFFNLLQDESNKNYYYASGGLEMLNLVNMTDDKDVYNAMTFSAHLAEFSGHGQVNFWLGAKGVTAYTHYDTSYNIHRVVRGKKRFILFPPEAYSRLALYPCLHQWYRQVGENVPKIAKDPDQLAHLLREVGGYDVELVAGGALYIPPYWFHCVITLETTFSLNIWSQSEAYLTMESIYKSPIPFEGHWGRYKLMKTLQHFVMLLIQESFKDEDSASSNIVKVIAGSVGGRYELAMRKQLRKDQRKELKEEVSNYCLNEDIQELLSATELEHLENRSREISAMFCQIESSSVREINLGNYLEYLAWRMLGTEDLLQFPLYLQLCFSVT